MAAQHSDVLFLAHRIPWPPDRGDRIRSWNLLRALAAQAPVHCGCLIEGAAEAAQVDAIASVTASHCLAPRAASLGWAGIAALVTGRPVSVAAFSSRHLADWVRKTVAEHAIGTIFVFSGQMAQYVPDDFQGRVVMDFVDVDSAKFAAYAATARSWPVRKIHAREARVLSVFEQCAARRADISLLVTPEECALFVSQLADPAGIAVQALNNGIDFDYFDPAGVIPEPALVGRGPNIVFTGQMDYAPNVAAVQLFARAVMPAILARHPDARFAIVGRAPTSDVRALDGVAGCMVTGEVPDVRPWLAAADCVVVPLQIARGVQNKVLEAMAMARPIVLTAAAAHGIAATDKVHFAVADGVEALADKVLAMLDNRAEAVAMGTAARTFVCENAGWAQALADLPAIMGWPDAG